MAYYWQGRRVERAWLERELAKASSKVAAYRRNADALQSVFLKRKTPAALVKAERAWMQVERQAAMWSDKARMLTEALARGDKRRPPPKGKWRYWVRLSYKSKKSGRTVGEVYFNAIGGRRLTEEEIFTAVGRVLGGKASQHGIVWHRVLYAHPPHGWRTATRGDIEGKVFAFLNFGSVLDFGEEQVS